MKPSFRLTLICLSALAFLTSSSRAQEGPTYDPVNGNAAIHVIIPNVDPVFFEDVTEHGGDPSILIRYTTLIVNSWFDAAAPYHPTAVAVFSDQPKRPRMHRVTIRC